MTRAQTQRAAFIIGAVGMLATALGWIIQPIAFRFAWLAAMTAWIGWPIGCMALLLIHALTGGRWGEAIQPYLLAGMRTLILLPLVVVPLIVVMTRLYPWLQPGAAAHISNQLYLNLPFFGVRGMLYLVVWLGLAALILRASGNPIALSRLAPPGLLLLAFTVTFAAIDTTMSLDPKFNSSVYGMLVATSNTLLALAISVVFASVAARSHGPDVRSALLADLGRLLLGLSVLWAYLDFMQLLIVWQSDLAEDAPWYVARLRGDWGVAMIVMTVLHFLLPFFLLMTPRLRRRPTSIAAICALLIAGELLHAWWLVLPASDAHTLWLTIAATCGIFGVATGIALDGTFIPFGLPAESVRE